MNERRAIPTAPWFAVGDDHVRYLRDGAQAFPALLECIDAAHHEILLEMYWVGADGAGREFRNALLRRAKAGVTVRVIYDAVGSFGMPPDWWRPLRDAGGEVWPYHTLWPFVRGFRMNRLNQRDHRKAMIVDGTHGFVGGINLAMPWMPEAQGGEGWRDAVVQVAGPSARDLRALFYSTWRGASGNRIPSDVVRLSKSRSHGRAVGLLTSRRRGARNIHREYLARIRRAVRHVDIANAYFVPVRALRRALFQAVNRGVQVRILIPEQGDVTVVHYAVQAFIDMLLRHGVEVYAMPVPILHSKLAIIDDFTTVGSYNLDERSWQKNLELNISVDNATFADHVRGFFESDLQLAKHLNLASWRQRPFFKRGIEWLAWVFRRFW